MVLDSKLRRYGFATIISGLAFAVAWPYSAFASVYFLSVMVSSLYGGMGPGLLSVAFSAVAYHYLASSFSYPRFAFFLITVLAIVGLIEAKRRVEEARRKIAAQVKKSEFYLVEAERLGHAGSWACTADLKITYLSPEMFRILRLPERVVPPSEQEIVNLFGPAAWARIMELLETARHDKVAWDGEFPAILSDGARIIVRIVGHPLLDPLGNIIEFVGTAIDVTEQRQAEEALQEAFDEIKRSEDQLRAIVDTMPAQVWCAAPDGQVSYANQRIVDFLGTSLSELRSGGWADFIHPDDRGRMLSEWSQSVSSGQPYEMQFRLRRSDGAYRWVHSLSRLGRDDEGRAGLWYGLIIDIDERKNVEEALRSTEARLSRAVQIATVGELSASIAHEINQPLAAIVASGHACVRFLSGQPPNLPKAYEAAESIVRDGKEAGEVVRRVRALFKRATTVEPVMLNLNDVIAEVLSLLSGETVKRHVAVETDLAADLPLVPGDRVQLQQLVLNLLLNGMEAMDAVRDRPKALFVHSQKNSPETVLVEVRDCGVGLENPDKIFEAFVTTKEHGMGMGLTICRSIVEAHNGRIWAASGGGPGATFCFALPLN